MKSEKFLCSAYFCSREALPESYPYVSFDVKVCLNECSNFRRVPILDKAVKSQCEHYGIN